MSGVVYAICAGDAVKFGVTKNSVEIRLTEMQTGNAHELGIAATYTPKVTDAYQLERMLHEYLSGDRIRGEWFKPTVKIHRIVLLMREGFLEQFLDPSEAMTNKLSNYMASKRAKERDEKEQGQK